jgi:peptide deformylase
MEELDKQLSAHQAELDRLDGIVEGGGKLDDVDEGDQGVRIPKPHKDLVVSQGEDSDLLRLNLKETPFPLSDPNLADLRKLENLFQELVEAKLAVGLAAQQANVTIRACCVRLGTENITMINPRIIGRSKQTKLLSENCLSIPCVSVKVRRPKSVTVEYYDVKGHIHVLTPMLHKHARRIEHEIDHLDGIMIDTYVDAKASNVNYYLPDWA